MNAENEPGEFIGKLESEDKVFIFDLVVRECFRGRDSLDNSQQYQCVHQCVTCSRENAQGLDASASVDLADGDYFTFPFEKRKLLISQLVHEFFVNKWKAKQLENKMLRMLNLRSSQRENVKSTSAKDDPTNEELVSSLHSDIQPDEPLQTLQIVPDKVKTPECGGPRKLKRMICLKLSNKSDIQPEQNIKNREEDSFCENSKVIMNGSEERSKNTRIKRPRNETENDVLHEENIDKYLSNKNPKLLKKTSIENIEKLEHLNQKHNSYCSAKTVVRTKKEGFLRRGIPENLPRRAKGREKDTQNEFVKSSTNRCSSDTRRPNPHFYTRDDRSPNIRYPTDYRKPKQTYYPRYERSPSNRYSTDYRNPKATYHTRSENFSNHKQPAEPRNPRSTYHIKVDSSQNSCIDEKFHLSPNDCVKPEYENTHCLKWKVERPPPNSESVSYLLVNDKNASFALDRQKVDIEAYQDGLANMGWNPTQALYEICSRSQWTPPQFWQIESVSEEGYLSSVMVRDHVFPAQQRGTNKRAARHLASVQCLRYLGFNFTYEPSQSLCEPAETINTSQ